MNSRRGATLQDHGVNCTSGGITCVMGLLVSDFIEWYF